MSSQHHNCVARLIGRATERSRFVVVLAIALVAAFAVAACGSSGKSSTSTTAAPAPAATSSSTAAAVAPAATGATFKIGAVCSCSGAQAAALADEAKVSQAWAASVNAAGGLDGHQVKMFTEDDGGNPATALQDVKTLVQTDHVQALVDDSLADAAFTSYVSKAGVPVVGGISSSSPFISEPTWFPTGPNLVTVTVGQFILAKAAGIKKLGVGYCAETPLCKEVVPLTQLGAGLAGNTTTALSISGTAPSYAAPCLSLKSQGVDALYVADNAAIVKRFVDGCAQEGFKPLNVTTSTTTDPSWLPDPNFAGTIVASGNPLPQDTANPGIAAFVAALNKYAPGVTTGSAYSFDTLYPWMAGLLFEQAVQAGSLTPSSTPAQVTAAMYEIKGATLDGLAPPLAFTKGAPTSIPCYYSAKITGGKYVMSNGGKPLCLNSAQAKAMGAALAKLA